MAFSPFRNFVVPNPGTEEESLTALLGFLTAKLPVDYYTMLESLSPSALSPPPCSLTKSG
jgi:hypothetical protein